MKLIQYIVENKEWLFSGIGLSAIIYAFTLAYRRLHCGFAKVQKEEKRTVNSNYMDDKSVYVSESPPDGTKCFCWNTVCENMDNTKCWNSHLEKEIS